MLVLFVEGLCVHKLDVVPHGGEMLEFLWSVIVGPAVEEIREDVGDGASFLLVNVVEHPQHVVATLKEEEVQDSDTTKDICLFSLLPL